MRQAEAEQVLLNRPVVFATDLKHSRAAAQTISLRLPAPLLSDLKALANKRDVPYQSLLKVFVADRVAEEWRSSKHRGTLSDKALQPTIRRRQKAKSKLPSGAARG